MLRRATHNHSLMSSDSTRVPGSPCQDIEFCLSHTSTHASASRRGVGEAWERHSEHQTGVSTVCRPHPTSDIQKCFSWSLSRLHVQASRPGFTSRHSNALCLYLMSHSQPHRLTSSTPSDKVGYSFEVWIRAVCPSVRREMLPLPWHRDGSPLPWANSRGASSPSLSSLSLSAWPQCGMPVEPGSADQSAQETVDSSVNDSL
jgi:hypothetical protein